MIKQINAWSFSRYSTYEQCAFKAKRLYIDKVAMETNDAMERGKRIHKLGEDYLKGKLKKVPVEYKKFKHALESLRKQNAVPEEEWCFDKDWWPTGWFDDDAWLRVKIDAQLLLVNRLRIIDYKTGKVRDGCEDQLDLYAGSAFARYKNLEIVDTQLWYLDSGELINQTYKASQAKALIKKWNNWTSPMLSDKNFLPNPNYFCRFCQFSKKVGDGSCRF